MTLYYKEDNVLKCEEIDYMRYKGPKGDRIEMVIIGGEYPEISIHTEVGVFSFYDDGDIMDYITDDCLVCYHYMLCDLIKQYVDDLNEDAIDLIISRVENTLVIYLEMCKHISRLLIQPNSKSARN